MECKIKYAEVVVPIDKVVLELSLDEAKMLIVATGSIQGNSILRWNCTSEIHTALRRFFPDFNYTDKEYQKLRREAQLNGMSFDLS